MPDSDKQRRDACINSLMGAAIESGHRLRLFQLARILERYDWVEACCGKRLGETINYAEDILQEMRETLLELQKIAPENK